MLLRTFVSIVLSTVIILATIMAFVLLDPVRQPSAFGHTVSDLGIPLVIFAAIAAFVGTGIALLMPIAAIVRRTVGSAPAAAAILIAAGAVLGRMLFLIFPHVQPQGALIAIGSGALSAAVWALFNRRSITRPAQLT